MRIVSERERYLDRLAKRVRFGTTWVERLLNRAMPVEERIRLIGEQVAERFGLERLPDVRVKVYRDKYDMAENVLGAQPGPLGLFTHYNNTIHLSAHDATDKVVAHEMARAVLYHLKGKKPESEESLDAARVGREGFSGQKGV